MLNALASRGRASLTAATPHSPSRLRFDRRLLLEINLHDMSGHNVAQSLRG